MTIRDILLGSAAAGAMVAMAPVAFAQTAVTQGASNDGVITNTGTISINGGAMGAGASAAVGATGAATVVSVSGINEALNGPAGHFAAVNQTSNNAANDTPANVVNNGVISGGGATLGLGSSVSASATGAVASVGFR